jgi:hypothetical protein
MADTKILIEGLRMLRSRFENQMNLSDKVSEDNLDRRDPPDSVSISFEEKK